MSAGTILYVEDEPSDVLLLETCFRQALVGLTLPVAKDGQEAMDYLSGKGGFADRQQYPLPTLVLLDLNLPRRSGHEVLEWIRRQPAFHTLPVIIFSASNHELDVHKAYALGANAYLVKPSGYASLLELTKALEAFWFEHNRPPRLIASNSKGWVHAELDYLQGNAATERLLRFGQIDYATAAFADF